MLPSGHRLPHRRLQNLLFELQSLPWFRSVDLGFGCCGLWFEFRMLGEFLLEFVELGFWIALGFESLSSSRWKEYSTLVRVASSLNFVGFWIFIEAWCVAIGFLENNHTQRIKRQWTSLKRWFFTEESRFDKGIILRLYNPTPTVLCLLPIGT